MASTPPHEAHPASSTHSAAIPSPTLPPGDFAAARPPLPIPFSSGSAAFSVPRQRPPPSSSSSPPGTFQYPPSSQAAPNPRPSALHIRKMHGPNTSSLRSLSSSPAPPSAASPNTLHGPLPPLHPPALPNAYFPLHSSQPPSAAVNRPSSTPVPSSTAPTPPPYHPSTPPPYLPSQSPILPFARTSFDSLASQDDFGDVPGGHGRGAGGNATGGKKSMRINRACDRCHRDKKKCDGQRPCLHCRRHGRKCDYTRTPAVKSRAAYRASLEQRLSQLEKMLAASGVDPAQLAAMAGAVGGGFSLAGINLQGFQGIGGLAGLAGLVGGAGGVAGSPRGGRGSGDVAAALSSGMLLRGMLEADPAFSDDDVEREESHEDEEPEFGAHGEEVGVQRLRRVGRAEGGVAGVIMRDDSDDDVEDGSYGGIGLGRKRKRGGSAGGSGTTRKSSGGANGKKRGRGGTRGKGKISGGDPTPPVQSSRRTSARRATAANTKQPSRDDEDEDEGTPEDVELRDVVGQLPDGMRKYGDSGDGQHQIIVMHGDSEKVETLGDALVDSTGSYMYPNAPPNLPETATAMGRAISPMDPRRRRSTASSDAESLDDLDTTSERSVGSRASEISIGFAERCERERERAERRNGNSGNSTSMSTYQHTPPTPPAQAHPGDESAGLEFAGVVRGFGFIAPAATPPEMSAGLAVPVSVGGDESMSEADRGGVAPTFQGSAVRTTASPSPVPTRQDVSQPQTFDDLSSAASVLATLRRHPSPYPSEASQARSRTGGGSTLREFAGRSSSVASVGADIDAFSGDPRSPGGVASRAASRSPVASPRRAHLPFTGRVGSPLVGTTGVADGYEHLTRAVGTDGVIGREHQYAASNVGYTKSTVESSEQVTTKMEEDGVCAKKRKVGDSSRGVEEGDMTDVERLQMELQTYKSLLSLLRHRSLALASELASMAVNPRLAGDKVRQFESLLDSWERELSGGTGRTSGYPGGHLDNGHSNISHGDPGSEMLNSFA
ncbi:hypothetical protein M427DRAFT_130523 [Gonapodya prolifera JEL478]|uniref:Zn(2)-C6 fungal-type domain-containing protein n=1 Tax=Gonapodya prolifera (strain JEL478) TaxID=1344416 RepID=A0A139AZ43_GONPJ|nr:hypothetical protein M427DRAFT_130523 [Gonapodya prolifera JEL478]|eukprot:KXS21823.1 hypothetical protein M427DRAFT_130523 [Gonapodya prolifera JEL478]